MYSRFSAAVRFSEPPLGTRFRALGGQPCAPTPQSWLRIPGVDRQPGRAAHHRLPAVYSDRYFAESVNLKTATLGLTIPESFPSGMISRVERVTHTLLAINYGAILTLLVPILVGWARQPTAVVPVWYGVGSVLAPLAAAGVIVFGLRDFFAARRAQRLVLGNAAELVRALPGRQCVLITGATGFIGRRLTEALTSAG